MAATRGVEVRAKVPSGLEGILSGDALDLVASLQREFGGTRAALLERRADRQRRLDEGERPDFLAETREVRERPDWKVASIPADLRDRRVEITGPVERKMMINALNSGAKVFMADFEDSNSPTWENLVQGQQNLIDAIDRTISFETPEKRYSLNREVSTLLVRPRGWHLPERHLLVDGEPVSGSLFDFGLYMFHNAKRLLEKGRRALLLPAEAGKPPRGAALERRLQVHPEGPRHPPGQRSRDGPDRDHPRRVRDGGDPLRAA